MNKFGSNKLSQYQQRAMNQIVRMPNMVQSTATPSINLRSSQISNIIECPLCKQSIRQSHMCPSCCKMFCESCIKNWLKTKKNECPCCQRPLNIINLINCSGLGRQIEQVISKSVQKIKNPQLTPVAVVSPSGSRISQAKDQTIIIDSPSPIKEKEILCQNHLLKIDYFCQDCLLGLCSDCAVLSQHHQGHRICRVSQKKICFQEKTRLHKQKLRNLRQIVTKIRDDKIIALSQLKAKQAEKQSQSSISINKLCQYQNARLDDHFFSKQSSFKMTLKNYEKTFQQVSFFSDFLSTKSKFKFVQNSHQISKCMVQSLKENEQPIPKEPAIVLQSIMCPQFETKTYILYNYNYLREKGDILISQPLFYKGTEWKLKIFPRGTNVEQKGVMNQFLGIHIQMSKGLKQVSRFRFRLQLVNQKNRQQCMSYQNEGQFSEGSEEHIDRFIQVSSLYNLNFVNSESGFIQVILYIKSASFFHGVSQQIQVIEEKEKQIECKRKAIEALKMEKKNDGEWASLRVDGMERKEKGSQKIVDNNN